MTDITLLLKVVALAILIVFGSGIAFLFREELIALFGAIRRRYLHISWPHLVDRIADDMSGNAGSEGGGAGSGTGSGDLVLGQQNQMEPELVLSFEEIVAYLTEHNLTDDQATIMFAVMRRESGDHFLSANKIRDIVGGADMVVKAQVAAYRPRQSRPKPSVHLERPANGW
jgi:hypothetical protein